MPDRQEDAAREWLLEAMQRYKDCDALDLCSNKVSEWARTARLFHHLATVVELGDQASAGQRWHVDAEYDRSLNNPKVIHRPDGPSDGPDIVGRPRRLTGRPDIVVHRRGMGGAAANLLVVECKREAEDLTRLTSPTQIFTDAQKVRRWMEAPYSYRVGALVALGDGSAKHPVGVSWVRDGRVHDLVHV